MNASTPSGAAWGCCGRCMWFQNPRASLCADQKDPAHKCGIGLFRPAKLRGKEKRKQKNKTRPPLAKASGVKDVIQDGY